MAANVIKFFYTHKFQNIENNNIEWRKFMKKIGLLSLATLM